MPAKGRSPGGKERATNWHHDKVPGGAHGLGWIAGDVHLVPCHPSRASRVCPRAAGVPDAVCAGCEAHKPVATLGYQPLFRADGRPLVIILREHQFDTADALKFGQRVRWGRAAGFGETVWIAAEPNGPRWESSVPERNFPADITGWLCRLWGMTEFTPYLARWFASQTAPKLPDVLPLPAVVEVPPVPTWVKGVQDEGAKLVGDGDFAALANRVKGKIAALPSPNGKHKKGK